MAKKKGDYVKILPFEGKVINDINDKYLQDACRISYKMKNGTHFWVVIPYELIEIREERV